MSAESNFDIVIVCAGPGGLSAALNAHKNNLNYILLEKTAHLADTIYCYQKGKPVMAEPTVIPKRGELWMEPAAREEILNHWSDAVQKTGLHIAFNEAVTEVQKKDGSFQVKTGQRVIAAKKIVLATGTQGNPRKLEVSGEGSPHVLPRLEDPEMFSEMDIVVVGGGDAGIEIAIALSARNRVTLCVRTSEFVRVKGSLERQVLDKQKKGDLAIHFGSSVEKIDSDSVTLKLPQTSIQVKAQVVIVKVGTLPLRSFLEGCGVGFPSTEPGATPILSGSYESSVPGLYLIGALSGRGSDLIKNSINQGYEVIEHILGHPVEPADEELLQKKIPFLTGTVSDRIKAFRPKTPLIAAGSEDQIRELLLFSEFHDVKPGETIFRQHDFSESLYMILDGAVDISLKSRTGEEKSVGQKGPGEFFGEMSLISGQRRSATVKAVSQARLLEVNRKPMLKLLHTTPPAKEIVDKTFLANAFQTYLFPNLDRATLAHLSDHAKMLSVDKGKVIIKEGDPGDAFYFLRSGKVKVSKNHEGQEIVLTYLSAGQYFGEMALMNDHPRMATVTAIDKVEVVQLLKEDFDFLKNQPRIKEIIEQETNRRRLGNIAVESDPTRAAREQFLIREEVVVGENVLLIDEDRCVHCDNCVKACEGVHQDGQTRIKRTGMKFANILIANSCRHCENALCLTDCPPGDAITRAPHGEVFIDPAKCIACGNCATNCPYDNIFMVHPEETEERSSLLGWVKEAVGMQKPAKPHPAKKALAVKCDLCRDLDSGPACVRSCPTGAVLRLEPDEYYKKIKSLVEQRKDEISN